MMIALKRHGREGLCRMVAQTLAPTGVIQGNEAAIEALILILTQLKAIWPARHIPLLGPFVF